MQEDICLVVLRLVYLSVFIAFTNAYESAMMYICRLIKSPCNHA